MKVSLVSEKVVVAQGNVIAKEKKQVELVEGPLVQSVDIFQFIKI